MSETNAIVRCVIYPGIGVARVGNAPGASDFFIGPEAPGEQALAVGGFKDAEGRIKRQAARFRVYGLNAAGHVVKEITANDAEVEWRVHVANRKAAWYQFNNAMDLGEFAQSALPRNSSTVGADRSKLVIDPGPRRISGRNAAAVPLDGGTFQGHAMPLGELRTDDHGRLLFLGGLGSAWGASPVTTFANNDGWSDDVSDGPVRATVRLGGHTFEAEPAMVVVAPPNYGQGIQAVVTMYDLLRDQFGREGQVPLPHVPSFTRDIYPILARLSDSQWVNQGFYVLFGQNSPSDFTAPEHVAVLADASEKNRARREAVFRWFRDPNLPRGAKQEPEKLPPFYGDTFGDFTGAFDSDLSVTRTQYRFLKQWASGEFEADWGHVPPPPRRVEDYPVAEQPHALDRAAMEDCLGGPFHPGCEITWVVRVPHFWKAPFRPHVMAEDAHVSDDFGPVLTPEKALAAHGPLAQCGPGTITRWMAVPWHTDTSSCLAGYDASTYLPSPTFWAARVPNQVLSEDAYERLMKDGLPLGQRLKHFDYRQFWLRDLGASYQQRINAMVTEWSQLGIVEARPGPADHARAHLPGRIWVETGRSSKFSDGDWTWKQVLIAEHDAAAPSLMPSAQEHEQAAPTAGVSSAAKPPAHARRRTHRRDEK